MSLKLGLNLLRSSEPAMKSKSNGTEYVVNRVQMFAAIVLCDQCLNETYPQKPRRDDRDAVLRLL